jgi:flagellar biosynthesis/type III secretory pathway protein FliH
VGVAEKKSLTNYTEGEPRVQEDGCRLHYFPDIPEDESPGTVRCVSEDAGFKRIRFENHDSGCAGSFERHNYDPHPEGEDRISIEEIEKKAYQRGFDEGKQAGYAAGEKAGIDIGTQAIEPVADSLHRMIQQFETIRSETYQDIEKEVVELALTIARKIVCHEVKTNRDVIVCVAREALSRVEDSGKVKIKMSPADLELIQNTKTQLAKHQENIQHVTFEASDSIEPGGCIIETDLGEIDARIEKQFQAVMESFQAEQQKSGLQS